MTVEEAYQQYGGMVYYTDIGDSLLSVCRKLYGSDGVQYRRILMVLNPRINWFNMYAGERLLYLSPDVLTTALF